MFSHEKSSPGQSQESYEASKITLTPPPGESLLRLDSPESLWPADVKQNEKLRDEAEVRLKLTADLEKVFEAIPDADVEIAEALRSKLIKPEVLTRVYDELSNFLETENGAERILLYLPFEILPASDLKTESAELDRAAKQFNQSYLRKWRTLLTISDTRANFVDGDIPEVELRSKPLPRVIKAAHFVPKLVEKNLLTADTVVDLLENSEDETLSDSLMDAIPVLADLGFLPAKTFDRLAKSNNPDFANLAKMIEQSEQLPTEEVVKTGRDANWLNSFGKQIEANLEALNKRHADRAGKIPEARIAWQKDRDERKLIETAAAQIDSALIKQTLSVGDLDQVAKTTRNTPFKLAIIRGLGKFLGKSISNSPDV
ncbi:MAG: hypothetical protein WC250_00185, partial [Candidatus Paceibacterota bacterium]